MKKKQRYWKRGNGNLRHGHAFVGKVSKIYTLWLGMKARCENPNATKYYMYGARGITVCDRWKKFENFLADMGEPPAVGMQLDRKDNDGPYSPDNCRWATRKEQARNRRDNHFLELNGKRATIAEWAEITGIEYSNIKNRINHLRWPVSRALTQPVKHLCRTAC